MTTDPTPSVATAAAALVRLLVRAEGDPACAQLLTAVVWTVTGSRIGGNLYPYGQEREHCAHLLEAARSLFGGEITPTTDRYDDEYAWCALSTAVAGVPVLLRAPAPSASVETQLRRRIAELEAQAAGRAVAA